MRGRLARAFRISLFVAACLPFVATIASASSLTAHTSLPWDRVVAVANGFDAHLAVGSAVLQSDPEGDFLQLDGALNNDSPLPVITGFVAIPNGSGVSVQAVARGFHASGLTLSNVAPRPVHVAVGDPVTFRGIRLAPVALTPARVAEDGSVQLADDVTLQIRFEGQDDRAPGVEGPVPVSAELERFLRANVMNLDEVDLNVVAPVGRLLIVAPNNPTVIATLQPYVHWKRQQGYRVSIESPSSNNSTAIKQLIQGEYNAIDPIPLEYVLMIGDHEGGISMVGYDPPGGAWGDISDHNYSMLDGTNILGDVAIGRFSVSNNTELVTVVNKTLAYERDPEMEPDWLDNVTLAAGSGSGISTIETNRSIKWMFNRQGVSADTLWYTMGGSIPDFLIQQINDWTSFVNYRGYLGMSGWDNSDLTSLLNGVHLPVVVTITCGTGTWGPDYSLTEGFFRAGTPTSPKGGVACIGTATTSTHTRFNNVVDTGIFEGMALRDIRALGWALVNGKNRLYQAYTGTSDATSVTDFSYWNNLMGDPALRVWIGTPTSAAVSHESNVPRGRNYLDVDVALPGDEWPDLVWATLATDDQVFDSRRIDESGHVRLTYDYTPGLDEFTLTVMGDNIQPYQATILTEDQPNYIAVESVSIDDGDGGNGIANPNDTVTANLVVVNRGSATTDPMTATVTTTDPRITLLSGGTIDIPSLVHGGSFNITDQISIQIADWCPDGARPELLLTAGGNQESVIEFPVTSWTATSEGYSPTLQDGERLMPGETAGVTLTLKNVGSVTAAGTAGILSCDDPRITVDPTPAAFGSIGVNQVGSNTTPIQVTASEDCIVGEPVRVTLRLMDVNGAVDSVSYRLYIGDPAGANATGPDRYGYWAVDDADVQLPTVPIYEWVDNTQVENRLAMTDNADEQDHSLAIDLPFTFLYYGVPYSQITVCTNGWVAMGDHSTEVLFRNWPIPNPQGPPAMIAPFWDDLRTGTGGVYASYEEEAGVFVITWDCTATDGTAEVFQLLLRNPAVWPTRTGNGQMVFQYQDIAFTGAAWSDNEYSTIGIENEDQQDGIQYYYWLDYADNASTVIDGRAILFTDDVAGSGGTATAVISPTNFDYTYVWGSSHPDSVTIESVGDGVLFWSMTAIGGEIGAAGDGREGQAVTRQPLQRTLPRTAETVSRSGRHPNSRPNPAAKRFPVEKTGNPLDDVVPVLNAGGPDSYGYVWRDSNEPDGPEPQWQAEYGTLLDTLDVVNGDPDDDYFQPLDLPFTFPFYDGNYTQVWINTNGFISFNPGTLVADSTWRNTAMPNAGAPPGNAPTSIVAPWWDDLDLQRGGQVYAYSGANDTLVVTWDNVPGWGSTGPRGGPYTFQVMLLSDGSFTFNYQSMGVDRLNESTIGFQNEDGTEGMTILHNAAYIEDGLTIHVSIPRVWLEVETPTGLTFPGETGQARFQVIGDRVQVGDYSGTLRLLTNDAAQQEVDIPVTLSLVAGGEPPSVSEIPDQTIDEGGTFDTIDLDEYVEDAAWPDGRIQWQISGAQELIVGVADRVVIIQAPSNDWSGSETLLFVATNPEGLSDSTEATFTVTFVDDPPLAFSLVALEDGAEVDTTAPAFAWRSTTDPEGTAISYLLVIESGAELAELDAGEDTAMVVDLAAAGLPVDAFQEYAWHVIASDESGMQTASLDTLTFSMYDLAVEEEVALPTSFTVGEFYPNPFNPSTAVRVGLPTAAPVRLEVFDLLGRRVASRDFGTRTAGYHTLSWQGGTSASGIYFLVVEAGPVREVRKAVLMK